MKFLPRFKLTSSLHTPKSKTFIYLFSYISHTQCYDVMCVYYFKPFSSSTSNFIRIFIVNIINKFSDVTYQISHAHNYNFRSSKNDAMRWWARVCLDGNNFTRKIFRNQTFLLSRLLHILTSNNKGAKIFE